MPIFVYEGSMQYVKTTAGVFEKSKPIYVTDKSASKLRFNDNFHELIGVKYIGGNDSHSLRSLGNKVMLLPKNVPRLIPKSVEYKLRHNKDFEFVKFELEKIDVLADTRELLAAESERLKILKQRLGAKQENKGTEHDIARARVQKEVLKKEIGLKHLKKQVAVESKRKIEEILRVRYFPQVLTKAPTVVRNRPAIGRFSEIRQDGSHGAISARPGKRYRLGVFVARSQGYVSGGYYHVWVTANILSQFFDVTIISPSMPSEYIKLIKMSNVKVMIDTNYLLDLGYSSFDMVMSLHGSPGFVAARYATRYNIPVYLHCFEPGNLVEKYLKWGRFSRQDWDQRKNMFMCADYVLFSNEFTRDWGRDWLVGMDPRKIVACIPPLNFSIADAVKDIEEKHEIVFISRLIPYKRPNDVLEVVKKVDKTLTVNYIGAHSTLNKTLSENAKRNGLKVNFYDAISEKEKFQIIKRSKFMIFPTSFEGYGLPPGEALYCKKPCVSYKIPVLAHNYQDKLEWAKERDIEELAKRAKYLLDNPDYRKQRGEEGHKFIKKRLNFDKCAKDYYSIMPPLRFSFFIIVFDGADYIEDCLKQIYPHAWEILIAEGGVELMAALKGSFRSSDGTLDIIRSFPDPENKIRIFKLNKRAWKDKVEMKNTLLKASTGHIIFSIDHDEFYHHEDIEKIRKMFRDDASLDVMEFFYYSFWKDFYQYRVDGRWGHTRFTRVWRKRGNLIWKFHDCPDRDNKPYRVRNFNGLSLGRMLYHYGYVREKARIKDKIEFMCLRDQGKEKTYRGDLKSWSSGNGIELKVFEGTHPEIIEERLNGKENEELSSVQSEEKDALVLHR